MQKYMTRNLQNGHIEVFAVADGEAVSFHLTQASAQEAIKRYEAVDRRRANQKKWEQNRARWDAWKKGQRA